MEREAIRRNTMQLQEWASWRHNQTVQQLQKLKEETIGKSSQECTFQPKLIERTKNTTTPVYSSASKLLSRKLAAPATQYAEEKPNDFDDSNQDNINKLFTQDSIQPTFKKDLDYGRHQLDEKVKQLENELQQCRSERDELISEKKFWLTKFQDDNAKLLALHTSLRNAKLKFIKEVDALEREKDRLRSLKLETLESKLEVVLSSSPLAQANRSQLPAHSRAKADEVHKTLSTLAMTCRANQLEVLEFVLSKVEEAEQAFLSRKETELENVIDQLKNIASSHPTNIHSAVNMSMLYPEAALSILMDKRDETIRREHGESSAFGASGTATDQEAEELIDEMSEKIMSTSKAERMDVKSLLSQNTQLRATLAQLRKKNVELKSKISKQAAAPSPAPTPTFNPSSSGGSGMGGGGASGRKSPVTTSGGPSKRGATVPSRPNQQEAARYAEDVTPLRMESTAGTFEELPGDYRSVAADAIITFVHDVVCSNPLSNDIPEDVMKLVEKEIAKQLKPTVGPMLWFTRNKEVEGRKNMSTEELNELIFDDVTKALSNPQVYSEIVSMSMLVLTYTHSRVSVLERNQEEPEVDDDMDQHGSAANENGFQPHNYNSSTSQTQSSVFHSKSSTSRIFESDRDDTASTGNNNPLTLQNAKYSVRSDTTTRTPHYMGNTSSSGVKRNASKPVTKPQQEYNYADSKIPFKNKSSPTTEWNR